MSRHLAGLRSPRVAPAVLGYAPLAVTGLVAGWLLASLPLLLAGAYRPLPATLLGAPAAVAFAFYVARRCPRLDGPAWTGWLTLGIVGAFGVLAWGWSSEHVVLRRDAGAYGLYAQALASSGRLPIPASAEVFGPGPSLPGAPPATWLPNVSPESPAFYADGGSVVPQFLPGTPMLLAVAGWLDGLRGILHANAILGAAGLLAVAGLAARLAGPRTAPFAALGTGLAYPVLHAARSPYSEPLALLLLFGGLALLAERRLELAGGLLAGLATVARIDAPADLLLLVPWAVLAAPLAGAGLALGVGSGLLAGFVLSRPYLDALGGELKMIAAAAAVLAGLSFAIRSRWRAGWRPAWLPVLGAGAVVVAAAAFAVRPLLQTVSRPNSARGMIEFLQRRQGLERDPTRTYDERTLYWVSWWLGWPLLVLTVAGLALLVHSRLRVCAAARSAAGSAPAHDPAPFLLVLSAATLVVLWKPSITPDHPWADRRLVSVILPGLVLCGAWLISRIPELLEGRLPRRRRGGPGRREGAAALAAVAVGGIALAPAALATAPLLPAATERGQVAAVDRLCARLGPRAAVVVTGTRGRAELPQTLRGLCGLPVVAVRDPHLAATVPQLRVAATRSGRELVVLAMSPSPLRAAGLTPEQVTALRTREDARMLVRRPTQDVPLSVDVWLAR